MVIIYRENGVLYVEAKMELRFPMVIKGVTYKRQEGITFEDVDIVYSILERNGKVLIKNGDIFKRMSLGEFADILTKKDYKLVENLPVKEEPKKEEKIIVPDDVVNKVIEGTKPEEVVVEPEPVKEEVKVEEKVEVKQQPKQEYQNNKKRNKDRQYNNNNKPQQPKEEVKVEEEKKGDDK